MGKKIVLVTVAMMGLSGLGSVAYAQQKITLDFSAHWLSAQRRPTIDKIVNLWNQRNPNVQVRYTGVPFDQIITKTLAGVAAGNAPDVVVIDIRTTRQRASKNQIVDMSQYGVNSIKDRFYPNLWSTGTFNGKQYGLPFNTDTRLLFYNKAAFREAGLNPNNPPKTWDDLWEYANKLDKKDSAGRYTRMGFHPLFGDFGYEGWVMNAKSSFWDADYEVPRVNNAVAVSTLNWVKRWTDRYGSNNYAAFRASFGGGAQDEFMSGKVPMVVKNGNYLTALRINAPQLQYGFVAVPTPDGNQSPTSSWGGGFNIEVPRGTKHPKEAVAFARFLATEGARIWTAEQNDIPGAKAALTSNTNRLFISMAQNMNNTFVAPTAVFAPNYGNAISKAVDDVILRGKSAKDALDDAQADVQKMVADGKRDAN